MHVILGKWYGQDIIWWSNTRWFRLTNGTTSMTYFDHPSSCMPMAILIEFIKHSLCFHLLYERGRKLENRATKLPSLSMSRTNGGTLAFLTCNEMLKYEIVMAVCVCLCVCVCVCVCACTKWLTAGVGDYEKEMVWLHLVLGQWRYILGRTCCQGKHRDDYRLKAVTESNRCVCVCT